MENNRKVFFSRPFDGMAGPGAVLRRAIYTLPLPLPWICGIPLGLLGDKSESARAAVSRVQREMGEGGGGGKKRDTGCRAREDAERDRNYG